MVHGMVQGVFFRSTTAEVAVKNRVRGWVRNNPSGTVEAVLEGGAEAVQKVIDWCNSGPPGASVKRVIVCIEEYRDEFSEFSIL